MEDPEIEWARRCINKVLQNRGLPPLGHSLHEWDRSTVESIELEAFRMMQAEDLANAPTSPIEP